MPLAPIRRQGETGIEETDSEKGENMRRKNLCGKGERRHSVACSEAVFTRISASHETISEDASPTFTNALKKSGVKAGR